MAGNTTGIAVEPSDYEKLMDIAVWFDVFDRQGQGSNPESDEVQRDLRRIAKRLLEIDGKKSFTRGKA